MWKLEETQKLIQEREAARDAKDWKQADTLRDTLESQGYTVKDSSDGPKISKQ